MIGNDIVDLKTANQESNWQRTGYLEKTFTSEEQFLILNLKNPALMLWVLWSMKEAVYKANFRKNPEYEYAPLKFEIGHITQNQNLINAEVNYQNNQYYTSSFIHENYVHSIAYQFKEDFDQIHLIEVENYSKNYIADLKLNQLILSTEDILKDKNGIPYLINHKINKRFPLSISHHGRYLGIISCYNHTV